MWEIHIRFSLFFKNFEGTSIQKSNPGAQLPLSTENDRVEVRVKKDQNLRNPHQIFDFFKNFVRDLYGVPI